MAVIKKTHQNGVKVQIVIIHGSEMVIIYGSEMLVIHGEKKLVICGSEMLVILGSIVDNGERQQQLKIAASSPTCRELVKLIQSDTFIQALSSMSETSCL